MSTNVNFSNFIPRKGKKKEAEESTKTLLNGEFYFEIPNNGISNTRTGGIKLGDGKRSYQNLPYFIRPINYIKVYMVIFILIFLMLFNLVGTFWIYQNYTQLKQDVEYYMESEENEIVR